MSALPVDATDRQLMELAMSAPQGYGRTWRVLFQAGVEAERARVANLTTASGRRR
jgi:hypothetical protein